LSLVADQAAISCQHLVDSGWLMMSSVDGFQGREADVVIFCTVRCNPKGSIGFLKDARRMNVAITRARRVLVVIGSRETLSSDPLWRRWIEWVHGN
jgi:regulator of nonsense transcripts 1